MRSWADTPSAPLNFLLSDYLGSTPLATSANGQPISGAATRYHPYGSLRRGDSIESQM